MVPKPATLAPNIRTPGRASASNPANRFDPYAREVCSDGWDISEEPQIARTETRIERSRSIIARNASPDISFDRSVNPYRGCEHGCIYCFARPTHAFLGYSPGLDFETRLVAKPNAAELLRQELSRRSYRVAPIAIGTNTDPYQPIEKQHRIMRHILETLEEFGHPVSIVTKGALIERDLDILSRLARRNLVHVGISVTTLEAGLSRRMEPRAPAPARRLGAIGKLADAGVPVRLMVAPVVPALTDHELEAILASGRDAGAVAASWIMLRLPMEVSTLFREWLAENCPDRAERVMARVREMHDGRDYSAEWGKRMRGTGHYANLVAHRFAVAAKRLGFRQALPSLDTDQFRVPSRRGDQLSLFD